MLYTDDVATTKLVDGGWSEWSSLGRAQRAQRAQSSAARESEKGEFLNKDKLRHNANA